MRRTQLYLDDDLWEALHARAQSGKTTISELVRQAVRERYMGKFDERRKAMQEFVGTARRRSERVDTVQHVRMLRRGSRLDRLHQ
jgi:metal-responsive CopG/Arc/MetJ family transcriptional regulator